MSDLCAVPDCPNDAEMFHPDRHVGLCGGHPEWVMAYGIAGAGGIEPSAWTEHEEPITRYYEETPCPECGRFDAHDEHGWHGPLRREVEPVPVVRMGGLSPAYYPAGDAEPDAYLISMPESDERVARL